MNRVLRLIYGVLLLPLMFLVACQGGKPPAGTGQQGGPATKGLPKKLVERKLAKDKGIDLEGLGRDDPFLPVSGKRPPKEGPARLTLGGVMGDMALLTKGDREWIVKVGDTVEDKRVKEIGEDGVILINEAGEETVIR